MDELVIPDGIVELWTVECSDGADGIYIDDLRDTEDEALMEIANKEHPEEWSTTKVVCEYKTNV